jgi:polyisoprenoid-binding protein YceI
MTITGDLRIRDITRPVTVSIERQDVSDAGSGGPIFRGHASIRRSDFDLRWYEESAVDGLVAGEVVEIDFTVAARPAS